MESRPLLSSHVLPRRHTTEHGRFIVLYDTERLVHHHVAERTWAVVSGMDGTRDVDGLMAYATRQGHNVKREEVLEFLGELDAAGLLVSAERRAEDAATGAPRNVAAGALGAEAREDAESAEAPAPDVPVLELPEFSLHCDGSGTCCRFYPSVVFTQLDAARARSHRPDVAGGGDDPERVFLPLLGVDSRALSVALVDGACVYLEAGGGCGVHRTSGIDQKPLGCRTYPARFVDDGQHLRVAPYIECACVVKSGERPQGASPNGSLVPDGVTKRSELASAHHVEVVPAEVLVGSARRASRAELVRWADALAGAAVPDGAKAFFALAHALETSGLDVAASQEALRGEPALPFDSVLSAVGLISERVEQLAAENWRSSGDMVRQTSAALSAACLLLKEALPDIAAGPGAYAGAEQFYFRTNVFGHFLVQREGRRSMSLAAFDRGVRVLLARALGVVASISELDAPPWQAPLALVDATMRGYGVAAYVRKFAIETAPADAG